MNAYKKEGIDLKKRCAFGLILVIALSLFALGWAGALAEMPDNFIAVDATPLTLDVEAQAKISSKDDGWVFFSFTATEAGQYEFHTSLDTDDETNYFEFRLYRDYVSENTCWSSGGGSADMMMWYLEADTTYYYALLRGDGGQKGTFRVQLEMHRGLASVTAVGDGYARVALGSSARLEVAATVNDASKAITYQWQVLREYQNETGMLQSEWQDIAGATSAVYETEPITEQKQYYCNVSDGAFSPGVWFSVNIENHFTATYAGDDNSISVVANSPATLEVVASCDAGPAGIHYQWYTEYEHTDESGNIYTTTEPIPGATQAAYETEPVTKWKMYYCHVNDDYNNFEDVYFNVNVDSQLRVEYDAGQEYEMRVPLGEAVTLRAVASSAMGEAALTYQWYSAEYYFNEEMGEWYSGESVAIKGATKATYTTEPVNARRYYHCNVSDGIDSNYLGFDLRPDTSLTAWASGTNFEYADYTVPLNDTTTLAVDASGEGTLRYQWSVNRVTYDENGEAIWSGETLANERSAVLTTEPITGRMDYQCRVSDAYGNYRNVWFYVYAQSNLTATDPEGNVTSVQYVTRGETPTLQVVASSDAGGVWYQWYRQEMKMVDGNQMWLGSEPIEGATGATYTVDPVNDYSVYYCSVRDAYGNSGSVTYHLRIENHLTATTEDGYQNMSMSLEPGETTTLAVTASSDDGAISYQWYKVYIAVDADWNWNWMPIETIDGATGATLTTEPTTRRVEYRCVASDSYDNTATVWFTITPNNHLTVKRVTDDGNSYNADRPAVPGGSVTLEAAGSSADGIFTYHWRSDSQGIIEGANASTYTVENVTSGEWYYCYVTDSYGNRADINFWVYPDNELSVERVGNYNVDVKPGSSVTLKVTATCLGGADTLSYQWYMDWDDAIKGANKAEYTMKSPMSGEYSCVVTDAYGNTGSADFYVKVDNAFSVRRVGGYDVFVGADGKATLKVNASCASGKLTYAWYQEDGEVLIESATGDNLALTGIEGPATYYCLVRDSYGNQKRVYFDIVLNGFKANRVGSRTVWAREGDDVTLAVNARCDTGELNYEWYGYGEDGRELIENATGSSLTLTNVSRYAEYRCVVSDSFGNSKYFYFEVEVETGVIMYNESAEAVSAKVGETVTFEVHAESAAGGLKLQWYQSNGHADGEVSFEPIKGATSASYSFKVAANSATLYKCVATDAKKNENSVIFRLVRATDVQKLTLGKAATATIAEPHDWAWFSFTPTETAIYTFYSDTDSDTYGYLYDSDLAQIQSDDDGGNGYNFSITLTLTAKQTYYFAARYLDEAEGRGEFPVMLIKGEPEDFKKGSIALTASAASVKTGEDLVLEIESANIYDVSLYRVEDGEWIRLDSWMEEDYEELLEYRDSFDTAQTLTFVATGWGEGGSVTSEEITVNVTSSGTLAKATLSVSAGDDGVKVTYTMPKNANHMRIRATVDGIQREYWATKSGTWTIANGRLPLGPNSIAVEATAYGVGYEASTATTSGSIFAHAAKRLALPAELTAIEAEAFANLPVEEVVIGSKCTTIGAKAFSGCADLKLVHMPDSVKSIATDAFSDCDGVTFICQSNNAAAAFAKKNGIAYVIE